MSGPGDLRRIQKAFSLNQSGDHAEAAKLCRQVLRGSPNNPDANHLLGVIEARTGNLELARKFMERSLSLQPANKVFAVNYASLLFRTGEYETAAAVSENWLQRDGTNIQLLYVCASSLARLNRLPESLARLDRLLELAPNNIAAVNDRGLLLARLRRLDEALASFQKVIAANPQDAGAQLNYANVCVDLGRYDEADAAYGRALAINPSQVEALHGLGNVAFARKQYETAGAAYDKAVSIHPGFAEAWIGRGNVCLKSDRYDEANAAFDKAIGLNPQAHNAWLGRGNLCSERKQYDDAFAAYERAIALRPELAEAWQGLGNSFHELGRHQEAYAAYDRAFTLKPGLAGTEDSRLQSKLLLCDWSNFDDECGHLIESITDRKYSAAPFGLLAIPSSPQQQLQCAELWVANQFPPTDRAVWQGEKYDHDRIRVAYLSADFRPHPVAYLAAGMFEHHDRSRFEVTALSFGPDDRSDMRQRLRASFDRFVDVEFMTDGQVAGLIRELEIDILVDLMGFTKGARTGIPAQRCAPVQLNYLGYPGAMGAGYIDYVIADRTLVPASHRRDYLEKVVCLPHSYMPHDEKGRAVSDRPLTRREFGLPDDGFVFCCFNNGYKINPHMFRIWMRLLKAVDRSILWLSEMNVTAAENLRKYTADAGVDPGRLLFAARLPSSADYLARHRLADLFLDTAPYNAHTTASDALWTGLPVLTLMGETFAGRVAASLLEAAGMPELIAATPDSYERTAVEIATRPELLAALKRKLADRRLTAPVFDTARFTKHIEAGYIAVHERQQAGLAPDHIDVPD